MAQGQPSNVFKAMRRNKADRASPAPATEHPCPRRTGSLKRTPFRGPLAPLGDALLPTGSLRRRLLDDRWLLVHRWRLGNGCLSSTLGRRLLLLLRRLLALEAHLPDPRGDEELDELGWQDGVEGETDRPLARVVVGKRTLAGRHRRPAQGMKGSVLGRRAPADDRLPVELHRRHPVRQTLLRPRAGGMNGRPDLLEGLPLGGGKTGVVGIDKRRADRHGNVSLNQGR